MPRFFLPLSCMSIALALLGGCRTAPPAEPVTASQVPAAPSTGTPPAPAPLPPAPAAAKSTLPDEQARLAALFRGTPVAFTMQLDGSLRVDVPLRFCFDPDRAVIKPALAAVLDRIAQSQRDTANRILVSAPGDRPVKPGAASSAASSAARTGAAASIALGNRRAASVRDRLVAQGIAVGRMTVSESDATGIKLLVKEPPTP